MRYARQQKTRWLKRWSSWSLIGLFSVIVLALSGYSYVAATMPLPTTFDATFILEDSTITADDAVMEDIVKNVSTPAAIGWLETDAIWANTDTPQQLASLTKLVTVLVSLEAFDDFLTGDTGPTYVWSKKDLATQQDLQARQGIIIPTPIGTRISLRDMVKMSLVPSANDYAIALAEWAYGSNAAFIDAVNEWAKRHDLSSLKLVEPSGMSPQNVASPKDLVTITRLALKHPVIAEVVSIQQMRISGIGTFYNTNPLLGRIPGVVGVKTGTLSTAGYNLITAEEYLVDDRTLTKITVVLGQPSAYARAQTSENLLTEFNGVEAHFTFIEAGTLVGYATAWNGQQIDLVARDTLSATLLPSETGAMSVFPDYLRFTDENLSSGVAGFIELEVPSGVVKASILSDSSPQDPGFWWRVQQPHLALSSLFEFSDN